MARDHVLRPERADGRREQERAVRSPAERDQHRAAAAEVLLERGEAGGQQVLGEPVGERRQVVEDDVGAGVEQLLAGAAAGEHRDAGRAGGQGALDVVDVVADVDRDALAAEHVGLADAPDLALEVVEVEPEVVDVQAGVRGELAGDDHDPAARGGVRRRRPRRRRRAAAPRRWRGRGRAPRNRSTAGPISSAGSQGCQHQVERRAEPGRHLLHGELDAELVAQRGEHRAEAGSGVDQGHVEVESDDERGVGRRRLHASQPKEPFESVTNRLRPWLVRAGFHRMRCMGRMGFGMSAAVRRSPCAVALVAAVLGACPVVVRRRPPGRTLYLVTLDGPGTAGYARPAAGLDPARRCSSNSRRRCSRRSDATHPVYRWTTALNGFAAELTPDQAEALRGDAARRPGREERGPAAGRRARRRGRSRAAAAPPRGGAGVVVGLVDTGIWPESSLFAGVPGLGSRGRAASAASASRAAAGRADDCNRKLVGARWFVAGFGEDNVRSSSSLSPLDDSGHGTQMASIAAGNAGVSVQVPGQRARPVRRRRAPGPDRGLQGVLDRARPRRRRLRHRRPGHRDRPRPRATASTCSTSRSAARRPSTPSSGRCSAPPSRTSSWSLPPATAAGRQYAAHPSPWVTSVGGTTGDGWLGRVALPDGARARRARWRRPAAVGPARLVLGAKVPAARRHAGRGPDLPTRLARRRRAPTGAIVVCERGGIGRVVKSRGRPPGRRRRHGAGQRRSAAGSSPTCTPYPPSTWPQPAAGTLRRWHARPPRRPGHPGARAACARPTPAVTPWSSTGDPTARLRQARRGRAGGRRCSAPCRPRSAAAAGTS